VLHHHAFLHAIAKARTERLIAEADAFRAARARDGAGRRAWRWRGRFGRRRAGHPIPRPRRGDVTT